MKTVEQSLKIDLHVHSPVSLDYLGDKSVRGYAGLVKAFVGEDVDAIAITDHNSIRGYLEYCSQAQLSRETYRLMAARDDNAQIIKELKSEVEYFDKLKVLAGVEITTYPGFHVILIFDDSIVQAVPDFLCNILKLDQNSTSGDPKQITKLSAIGVLDEATRLFGDKFFCVLPHVESSKGAWAELDGIARAQLFRDERVLAVQYSNPETTDRIASALKNADYKRQAPLCFIQCSDYHGAPNIKPASQYSVIEGIHQLDFAALKAAFANPSSVRCSSEFVDSRLSTFIDGRPTVSFEFTNKLEFDGERKKDMSRALCGVLNSQHAVIRINLLNVSDTDSRTAELVSDLIHSLQANLDPANAFAFTVAQFHQSSTRQRYCITIDRNTRLRLFEGVCWVVNGTEPEKAPAWRIEQIVAEMQYVRFGKSKQRTLEDASVELIRVSNAFPAMPIAARLEPLLSRKACGIFEVNMLSPKFPSSLKDDFGCNNGFADGDFIQLRPEVNLKGGRLAAQNSYYRFSAPTFRYRDRKEEDTVLVGPKSAIIFPDGGTNLIVAQKPIFAPYPVFEVKVPTGRVANETTDEEVALGLVAWLKSSFVLWYSNSVYQTDDIFEVLVQRLRIPLTDDEDLYRRLSFFAKNIMRAEHDCLHATSIEKPNKHEKARVSECIGAHNKAVNDNMRLIDLEVFRHLKFSAEEIKEVYRVLRVLALCDYGIGLNLDDFLKQYEPQRQ